MRLKTTTQSTGGWKIKTEHNDHLDFKVSPCSEYCILSSGWVPGVWILCRRFGTPVCSNFVVVPPMKMKQCSETSAHKIQTPGYNAIILLIRLPIFTSLGMGLESLHLFLMPQSRPLFLTSRLLVSPNSMVRPRRCRRGDRAFCFGLLYVAFLNPYVIFTYTKEHGEFQSSYLRLYVISRPIFAFLHLRLFLQYRLRVQLQCFNYCVFRLLLVCDSFIDHETVAT